MSIQQASAQAHLDRLKELQRSYSWGQAQLSLESQSQAFLSNQHSDRSGASLIPGPASPQPTNYDSHAPALRNVAADTSNGSGPLSSHYTGSIGQSLPAMPPAADPLSIYGEALAIPDLSYLDFPDMFGDLDIPSLEDLVQDIGAAEAELMGADLPEKLGLLASGGGGGGAVATGAMNLHRSQTLPAPSTLPKPTTQPRRHVVRRSPTPARHESLPPAEPAAGSDGSVGGSAGARRKRKNTLETQVETHFEKIPEAILAPNVAMQQPEVAQPSPFAVTATPFVWTSPAASADDELDDTLSRRPSKKVEIDFILDDDALLERVMNDTAPFIGLSRAPKTKITNDSKNNINNNEIITLAPAMSLPNRHWLSPAAAIHAAHASRPGDEDVLKWLVYGKL